MSGNALGDFLGGQLLVSNNNNNNINSSTTTTIEQQAIRTYNRNFVANLILSFISLILLLIMYRLNKNSNLKSIYSHEKIQNLSVTDHVYNQNNNNNISVNDDDDETFEHNLLNNDVEERLIVENNNNNNDNNNNNNNNHNNNLTTFEQNKPNLMRTLFRFGNIKRTYVSLVKQRERQIRLTLYILLVIMLFQIFVLSGMANVQFQFVEKVYHWNSRQYTTYSSMASILSTVIMFVATTILVKWLHFDDGSLMIIAHLSAFLNNTIRGTFLTEWAFFIAIPIGMHFINKQNKQKYTIYNITIFRLT